LVPTASVPEHAGAIEIGAHTLTHPVLALLPLDQQEQEIGENKRRLEALIGQEVTSVAYPNGKKHHYRRQTVEK
jgi:peptidoglycan/xylan/chitin deacetylase (PgdA/CDA1 family)